MLKKRLCITGLIIVCTFQAGAAEFDRKTLDSVIKTVQDNTHYKVSDEDIYRGAIQGIMQILEDKNMVLIDRAGEQKTDREVVLWSQRNVLLNPVQTENLEISTRGQLTGVGIALQYNTDEGMVRPVITHVIPESGAQLAGIQVSDQILHINEKSIDQFGSLTEIVNAIRGPVDTKVRLSVLRGSEVMDFDITRKNIEIKVVRSEILEGNVGYLKLENFNEKAAAEVSYELNKFKTADVDRLILDLRGNSGGVFNVSTEIMAMFMKKDDVLVQQQTGTDNKLKPVRAASDGIAADMYVVVLADGTTSSVAEAAAVMLRDRDNAILVGSPTFGKASLERMFTLSNNYRLLMTTGMLYDSKGRTWQGTGIMPHIFIPGAESADNVLEMAKDYMKRLVFNGVGRNTDRTQRQRRIVDEGENSARIRRR